MTLLSLPPHTLARITGLTCPPALCQQLWERGLTEGTPVRLMKKAPLGDPLSVEVRGSVLTLRKALAEQILVSVPLSALAQTATSTSTTSLKPNDSAKTPSPLVSLS